MFSINTVLFLAWSITVCCLEVSWVLISPLKVIGVTNYLQGIKVSALWLTWRRRSVVAVSFYFEATAVRGLSAWWWHIEGCGLCDFGWWSELHVSGCFLACQCHFAGSGPRQVFQGRTDKGDAGCFPQLEGQNQRFLCQSIEWSWPSLWFCWYGLSSSVC